MKSDIQMMLGFSIIREKLEYVNNLRDFKKFTPDVILYLSPVPHFHFADPIPARVVWLKYT